jgi:hypothetical protein
MRVMDFYRCENGLIAENWVPLDIIPKTPKPLLLRVLKI